MAFKLTHARALTDGGYSDGAFKPGKIYIVESVEYGFARLISERGGPLFMQTERPSEARYIGPPADVKPSNGGDQ